jgi:hypothetical protein
MTISNSKIFTTTVFGNSSGLSSQDQSNKNTETVEKLYSEYPITKMNTRGVVVPSNQRRVKGK